MKRISALHLLTGFCLMGALLTSCGDGAGGSDSGTPGDGPINIQLGSRALQQTTVTVFATSTFSAGGSANIRVETTGDTPVTGIAIMRGQNYDLDPTPVTAAGLIPLSATQIAALSLPQASATDVFLARITFDDGSEVETDLGAFLTHP